MHPGDGLVYQVVALVQLVLTMLQFPLKVTVEGGKTGEAAQAADLNFYHQNVKLRVPQSPLHQRRL